MDTQADKQTERMPEDQAEVSNAESAPPETNGVSVNGYPDLATWYLEELRAMRRAQPPGGLRIFNPDETPEEREVRIRETLAGLRAMQEFAAEGTEEDGRVWDEVMKAVERSRSGSSGPDQLHTIRDRRA
jgi:hypothetical protein